MGNIAMQLAAEALTTEIPSNGNVLFNITQYVTDQISYDADTGMITLTTPGRYIVHWWLSTQSSLSRIGAAFALVPSSGDMRTGASPIKMGQVNGFGIFTVESALNPLELSLQNVSQQAFYFNVQTPLQGSLIIMEDTPIAEAAYGYVYTPVSGSDWVAEAGNDVVFMQNGPLVNVTHTVVTSEINILEDGDYEIHYTFVLAEPSDVFLSLAVNGVTAVSTSVPTGDQAGEFSDSAILSLVTGDVVTLRID